MKKIILRLFIISILANQHLSTFAQDSTHLRISLLTCTPGDLMYSTYGHSALRVIDSGTTANGQVKDIIFNYGTFDFEDPAFLAKFVRGKLRYFVSADQFVDFIAEYQYYNRGIYEQVLNLTAAEKTAIKNFLLHNIKEENKYYQYDFLFDNCTTRLRDIIVQQKHIKPVFKNVMPAGTRFRQAIHLYLDKRYKEWDKLGIDILLGAPVDAVMTTEQQQFLPDNLMMAFDSTNQLVASTSSLYPYQTPAVRRSWFNPLVVFSLLLMLIVLLDFSKNKMAATFLKAFDRILFFCTGAMGILLLFMWFGTDHAMCKNNYNLLWAFPTHIFISFVMGGSKRWVKKYFFFTAVMLLLLSAAWYFLPQQLNTSLLAVVLLLLYRSLRKYQTIQ